MSDHVARERAEPNRLATLLNMACIAAGIAAMTATGGLASVAGVVAGFCLAGSILASLAPSDTGFERDCEESSLVGPPVSAEPSPGRSQDAEMSHYWRQSVMASRTAGPVRLH